MPWFIIIVITTYIVQMTCMLMLNGGRSFWLGIAVLIWCLYHHHYHVLIGFWITFWAVILSGRNFYLSPDFSRLRLFSLFKKQTFVFVAIFIELCYERTWSRLNLRRLSFHNVAGSWLTNIFLPWRVVIIAKLRIVIGWGRWCQRIVLLRKSLHFLLRIRKLHRHSNNNPIYRRRILLFLLFLLCIIKFFDFLFDFYSSNHYLFFLFLNFLWCCLLLLFWFHRMEFRC